MQPADQQASRAEAGVGGHEDGAGEGRSETAHREYEDGRKVEDRPAGGHEAQLGEAGQKNPAVLQHHQRDDGIRGHAILDGDEAHEAEHGEYEGNGLDRVGGETVQEQNDRYGLKIVCGSHVRHCLSFAFPLKRRWSEDSPS